jgi:hypothetical protein
MLQRDPVAALPSDRLGLHCFAFLVNFYFLSITKNTDENANEEIHLSTMIICQSGCLCRDYLMYIFPSKGAAGHLGQLFFR